MESGGDADVEGARADEAAVNLITTVPKCRVPRRALVLWALQQAWLVRLLNRVGLLGIRPVDGQLRRLNHLHVARWSLVRELPSPPGAASEDGRYTLLLFTSHFDFGWRRYLGTFIETTGDGLANLWGDLDEWRNPSEGARAFENFVVDQQVPNEHVYAAFPGLSCNDIRSAARISRELTELRRKEDQRNPGPAASWAPGDDEVNARHRALLRRLQHCLRPFDEVPAERDLPRATTTTNKLHESVTCIFPYTHGEQTCLRSAIGQAVHDAASDGSHPASSPFALLPGTHFARLAMIGEEHFVERSVPPLANGYLLLSAELDGDADEWLSQLHQQGRLAQVFELCHGYPGPKASIGRFIDWVESCRIPPSLEYVDYPHFTVQQIEADLRLARGALDEIRKALVPPDE